MFTAAGLAFFGLMGLLDPGVLVPGGDAEAARVFAGLMGPRNLALGGAAVVLLVMGRWRDLGLVLVLNAVVQAGDAILGAVRGELLQTVSPALIAVALVAAADVIRRSDSTTHAVAAARS